MDATTGFWAARTNISLGGMAPWLEVYTALVKWTQLYYEQIRQLDARFIGQLYVLGCLEYR